MKRSARMKFTVNEDRIIKEMVNELGINSFELIASRLPNRTAKQCHDRYINYLIDGLKTGQWTKEEDELLIRLKYEIGPRWMKMTSFLKGRSGNDIKNRWHKHLAAQQHKDIEFEKSDPKSSCTQQINRLNLCQEIGLSDDTIDELMKSFELSCISPVVSSPNIAVFY